MNNIKKAMLETESKRNVDYQLEIDSVKSRNTRALDYYISNLLPKSKRSTMFDSAGLLRDYLSKRLQLAVSKRLGAIDSELEKLDYPTIKKAEYTINVEWTKSRTWGMCPRASVRAGNHIYDSGIISGCGYCKISTAVASVLNQIPNLVLKMAKVKNGKSNIERKNHVIFGYGSGYGIVPKIEGGVGVECYPKILESIGGKFERVAINDNTDVFKVTI